MSTERAHWATPQGTMFPRQITVALLLVGPIATIAFLLRMVGTSWLNQHELSSAIGVALVFWSPIFFSVPALLLQDVRDATLDSWQSPVGCLARGFVLMPYLVFSKSSPARLEAVMSLVGFAAALILALAFLL